MIQSLLKWLAAGGVGAVVAGLQAFLAHSQGAPPVGVDPIVTLVVVSLISKLVQFLIGKLPHGVPAGSR